MTLKTLRIIARAAVSDRSWRGELSDVQLADRAYALTDLFLGQITYFDPETRRIYGPGSHRVPILGHLFALGEVLVKGRSESIGTHVNEWRLRIDVTPEFIACGFPAAPPMRIQPDSFRQEVAMAITDCRDLALCAAGHRQMPEFLEEARGLVEQLRDDN